jgi:hypothetical protein
MLLPPTTPYHHHHHHRHHFSAVPQLWRISDLLYLPEEQVVAELEAHR